ADIVADLDKVIEMLERSPVMLSEEQKIDRLKELAFFARFSKNELKEVARAADWREYGAGEAVFTEGTKEKAFYVVAEGSVAVTINGTRIRDLEVGDCFGEMEYLSETGRTATVLANRDSTIVKVERDYKEWASLPTQVRLNRGFQEVLIERLQTTSKELARALSK
ncbi:MAG: cyclic nucleotide-binding domain-containing protein, partial [Gammaproteobacteria bacterium]